MLPLPAVELDKVLEPIVAAVIGDPPAKGSLFFLVVRLPNGAWKCNCRGDCTKKEFSETIENGIAELWAHGRFKE